MRVAGRDFQTLFEAGALGGLSDAQLLERFVARREESIFEAIVHRHGTMVWGVCRRVLRDHHDAEDAFQATFLVLARKASSVANREKLGNWLYGVAYQTAMKARATRARRRGREGQVSDMPEPEAVPQGRRDDLAEWLEHELSRLPEKYRIPIVLCELEGKTHREAAERLGWPIGTVSGRLSRARMMLAKRLDRRGVSLAGGSLAVLLVQERASACLPTRLIGPTVRAASLFAAGGAATSGMVSVEVLALMEGVSKMMLLSKIKIASAAMLVVVLLVAGGIHSGVVTAASDPAADQGTSDTKPATKTVDLAEQEAGRLQGTWVVTRLEQVGHQPTEEEKEFYRAGNFTITIKDDTITYDLDKSFGKFTMDPTRTPKVLFLRVPDRDEAVPAIYRLDGDDLMICQGRKDDTEPPAGFSIEERRPGTFPTLLVMRRKPAPSGEATKGEGPRNGRKAAGAEPPSVEANRRLAQQVRMKARAEFKTALAKVSRARLDLEKAREAMSRAEVEKSKAEDELKRANEEADMLEGRPEK